MAPMPRLKLKNAWPRATSMVEGPTWLKSGLNRYDSAFEKPGVVME